jgi:hypothetical protein
MSKLAIFSVGLSAAIFSGLIPAMEINSTHLFNPEWPEHARLHEAWQLLTNASISLLAVACVWTQRAPRLGISLALIICGAFLTAWVLGSTYDGSMLHTDGTQMAVAGINVAVIVVFVVTGFLIFSWLSLGGARQGT